MNVRWERNDRTDDLEEKDQKRNDWMSRRTEEE
jgi:hypothetical protein